MLLEVYLASVQLVPLVTQVPVEQCYLTGHPFNTWYHGIWKDAGTEQIFHSI